MSFTNPKAAGAKGLEQLKAGVGETDPAKSYKDEIAARWQLLREAKKAKAVGMSYANPGLDPREMDQVLDPVACAQTRERIEKEQMEKEQMEKEQMEKERQEREPKAAIAEPMPLPRESEGQPCEKCGQPKSLKRDRCYRCAPGVVRKPSTDGVPAPIEASPISKPELPRKSLVPPLETRMLEAAKQIEAEGGVVSGSAVCKRIGVRFSGHPFRTYKNLQTCGLWPWGAAVGRPSSKPSTNGKHAPLPEVAKPAEPESVSLYETLSRLHDVPNAEIVADDPLDQDLAESGAFDAIDDTRLSNVEHPPHYNAGGIECIDALQAIAAGYTDPWQFFLAAQVVKYAWRGPLKNGTEDYRKARFYLDRLIETTEVKV